MFNKDAAKLDWQAYAERLRPWTADPSCRLCDHRMPLLESGLCLSCAEPGIELEMWRRYVKKTSKAEVRLKVRDDGVCGLFWWNPGRDRWEALP